MTPIIVSGTGGAGRHNRDASSLPLELANGNPGQCGYAIGSIQVQDGEPIRLVNPGVTAIVGGNNAGKSTLLRQIRDLSAIEGGAPQNP